MFLPATNDARWLATLFTVGRTYTRPARRRESGALRQARGPGTDSRERSFHPAQRPHSLPVFLVSPFAQRPELVGHGLTPRHLGERSGPPLQILPDQPVTFAADDRGGVLQVRARPAKSLWMMRSSAVANGTSTPPSSTRSARSIACRSKGEPGPGERQRTGVLKGICAGWRQLCVRWRQLAPVSACLPLTSAVSVVVSLRSTLQSLLASGRAQ